LCRVGGEAVAVADFSSLLGAADRIIPVVGIIADVSAAGGVAARVASASAVTSSSAATVGGISATAAAAATATAPTAVATMRGSSHRGSKAVGCWLVFATDVVTSANCCGVTATINIS
jgi:hypothetical protein